MAKTALPAGPGEGEIATRLRRVNLDLLPVLHELLRTRSVTRTARGFGMTQPAVSRALRQLRQVFEDELLVRLGREVRLTPRAEALGPPLQQALGGLDRLLRPAQPFDPKLEAVHISITTADYVSLLLAPILAEICAMEAPQVVIEFVELGVRSAEDLARVDFMIGPRAFGQTLGKRIGTMPLWRDEMVCVVAARNRGIPSTITPEQLRRTRQAGYQQSPRQSASILHLLQPTSGLETNRVCTVRNFLVLGAIVERADCVALVPRKVAQELLRSRALRIVEVQYAAKRLWIDAYWGLAANAKRGHAWFQGVLARAAERLS